MKEQPTIVLLTDYSDASATAIGPTLELAERLGGRVMLLHVLKEHLAIPHGAPLAPPMTILPDEQEALMKSSRAAMEELRATLGDAVPTSGDVLSGPIIHEEVQRFADKNGADFVALSSHGRTGFRRALMGSVAEAVLRHTNVPVIIYPSGE